MKKRNKDRKEQTTFDPKIHHKTKGGHGFGMKRGVKVDKWENSGAQLAAVFGWELPEHLKHLVKKK